MTHFVGQGRIRSFVRYPKESHCPLTPDDIAYVLPRTGSYPSTHAMVAWIWASILTAAAPDRANALIGKGLSFGESRPVCGFHYRSDVEAGRIDAAALMGRLQAEPAFVAELARARIEIAAARAARPTPTAGTAQSRQKQ